MINSSALIAELNQTPDIERLQNDLGSSPKLSPSIKPFKVRQFSLGEDINIDREELHAERNV
jgi:hypothetical protein